MSLDSTDLSRLHDIIVPEPVPWWPPAPGWLWLLGIALVAAVFLLVKAAIHWQQNCYRREALAELGKLEQLATQQGEQARALQGMSELLKRTAVTAYPRPQVATLSGTAWFDFLDETAGTAFGSGLGASLEASNYRSRPEPWAATKINQLATEARRWIRQHRVAPEHAVPPDLKHGDVDASVSSTPLTEGRER